MSDPVCPWSSFDAGTVAFCEARLCAWIAEPSNAWSSLGYIAIGAWLLFSHALRTRPVDARLVALALAEILIGVGSFAFHASGTFIGEVIDQVGMFMLSCLILAYAAGRARGLSSSQTALLYVALTVASSLLLLVVRPIGIPLFALQLAVGLGWEIAMWRRAVDKSEHRLFFRGLAVFLVSFAIWLTDITKLLCDPDNHLVTGHAIWHVLNAVCIERLYRFYAERGRGA